MHQGCASKSTLLCFFHLNFKVDVNVVLYLQRQLFHALSGYLQIITNTPGSMRIPISKRIDIPQSSLFRLKWFCDPKSKLQRLTVS